MTTFEHRIDENLATLEAQLERWTAALEEAVGKARRSGQELKAETRTRLDDLRARLGEARATLDAARAAGAGKVATLEHGLARTWKELGRTVEALLR